MNIPFLQDTTFTGIISTQDYKTSREWSQAFTLLQANSADWVTGSDRLWGTISGVLSTQTDLWSELSAKALNVDFQILKTFVETNSAQWDESGDIIPTVVDFLSSNLVTVQTLNATSQILSGGVDISDIFITSAEESQNLTYDPETFKLSIDRGNEVSLSSIPLAAPVQSVNGYVGAVVLSAQDVGALQSYYDNEFFYFDGSQPDYSITQTMTFPARRNTRWFVQIQVSDVNPATLILPREGTIIGDRIYIVLNDPVPPQTTFLIKRPSPGADATIATLGPGARFVYAAQCTRIVSNQPIWEPLSQLYAAFNAIPASVSAEGQIGSFVFADKHMYVCIAQNTWRRATLASF